MLLEWIGWVAMSAFGLALTFFPIFFILSPWSSRREQLWLSVVTVIGVAILIEAYELAPFEIISR